MKGIFGNGILNVETEGFKGPARYASMMDYAHLDYPILTVPGKYDIAAVRYLYFGEMELKDGKTLNLSGEGSILEQALAQGVDKDQIKYRACNLIRLDSPNHKSNVDGENPLCAKFDYGSTPKEIVEIKIRDVQDYIVGGFRRYDRDPSRFGLDSLVVGPDIAFYPYLAKWRKLLRGHFDKLKKDFMNYSSFNKEEIEKYEEIVEAEAARNEEFRSYYEIIPVLSDFMRKTINVPFKRCVYERPDETFYSVNLEVIKARIKGDYSMGSGDLFVNCESESVRKWAKESGAGDFVTEVGTFVKNQEYFVNPFKTDPWDEISTAKIFQELNKQLIAYLVFEPGVRRRLFEFEKENWLKGQDINPYINDSPRIQEVRKARGLSVDCRPLKSSPDLPECEPLFPRFSINELQEKYMAPDGVSVIPKSLHYIQNISTGIIRASNSEKVESELRRAFFELQVNDIVSFQDRINNLIQDSSRALTNMSDIFETTAPFLYQSYKDYTREYDTPEKQRETSFIAFLKGLPSGLFFEEGSDGGRLILPFVSGGLLEEGFRQYNRYKACISEEDCADRQEKESFIQLIDNKFKRISTEKPPVPSISVFVNEK